MGTRAWMAGAGPRRGARQGPSSTQERRGQPEGPREAPQERTRGLQAGAGGASGSTAAGSGPGKTQLPASPRRAALRCQWPYLTCTSDALVGLVRSRRGSGPDRADGAEWAEGGAAGRAAARPHPRPARPVPRLAARRCSAPCPFAARRRPPGALRPRGWRRGGAGADPGDRGADGAGEGPPGQGGRGPSAGPAKSGPFPVLGCCSAGRLPTSLLAAHSPISWRPGVSAAGPGTPYSPLTRPSAEMALGAAESSPPGVPLPGVPLLRTGGLRSFFARGHALCDPGSQCVSCTGVPATQR